MRKADLGARLVATTVGVAALCGLAPLATSSAGAAALGTYDLDEVLVPGQPVVQPQDVTNAGVIVGFSGDSVASVSGQDDVHGFIHRDGAVTVVDRPGTRWTYLTGLADDGVASGYSGPFDQHGFALGPIAGFTFDGDFTPVEHAGYTVTFVTAIDDRGHVVGFSVDGTGAPNGFDWNDGVVTELAGPDGEHVYPTAITEPAWIVMGHDYSYWSERRGEYRAVSVPAPNAVVHDMNNSGDVVGSYFDGRAHGFVYGRSGLTTVDYPGADETRINGINDHGEIVGEFLLDGVWRGFVGRKV